MAAGPVIAALREVGYSGPRGEVRMQRHAALTMRLCQVLSDGSIAILATYPQVPAGEQCPGL